MVTDWTKQEHQLESLTTQAQRYLTTFRWLWLLNAVAAVAGIVTHHYELTAVTAGTSLISLIGVAFAQKGRRTVSETTSESHRIHDKCDPVS